MKLTPNGESVFEALTNPQLRLARAALIGSGLLVTGAVALGCKIQEQWDVKFGEHNAPQFSEQPDVPEVTTYKEL